MFEELKPHIAELRKRLIIAVVGLLIAFGICFSFHDAILIFLKAPLDGISAPNGANLGAKMIYTHPAELFFVSLKVSFFGGFLLSLPLILYQIWAFVAPGLYENEKKYIAPFVFFAYTMFLAGCSFCYYFVVPTALNFLLNFGDSGQISTMLKVSEFVGFFTKLLIAFGISFELPVVTFFLAVMGLVSARSMLGFFRYAIVGIFIFAAIMTPPDILSQLLLAVPLIMLYALSILIAKIFGPKDKDE